MNQAEATMQSDNRIPPDTNWLELVDRYWRAANYISVGRSI
jgi:phosphoketolase